MIKLIPDPTFDALVKLTVPGHPDPVEVPMTFRHMASDKVADWFKTNKGREAAAALCEVIEDWRGVMGEEGCIVPFSKDALSTLLKNYPAAAKEIFDAWIRELNESRIKN